MIFSVIDLLLMFFNSPLHFEQATPFMLKVWRCSIGIGFVSILINVYLIYYAA